MFSRLGGLAPSRAVFSSLLSLRLFSRVCIRVPPLLVPFWFSYSLLGSCSLGMAMSVLHFLYLTGPYHWNVGNVWFTFLLCVVALCMMYLYLYLLVYGWLCTLYDRLSWLHEWPSLVIRALDLIMWVCVQGNCHGCIFMLYCVHNYRNVIVLIHVTKWRWFPRVCDMHQYTWCFEGLRLVSVRACWYTLHTQTQNPSNAP